MKITVTKLRLTFMLNKPYYSTWLQFVRKNKSQIYVNQFFEEASNEAIIVLGEKKKKKTDLKEFIIVQKKVV